MALTSLFIILLVAYVFFNNQLNKLNSLIDENRAEIILGLEHRHQKILSILNFISIPTEKAQELISISLKVSQTHNIKALEQAETILEMPLKEIHFLIEKSLAQSKNFELSKLKNDLIQAENDMQNAYQNYNSAVRDFNVALHTIPTSWIAKSNKIKEKSFFDKI